MCNAFGHLMSCRCGWGHPGVISYTNVYPDRQGAGLRDFAASFYKNTSFSSTRPNYKCKWCGEKVFYFKSNNGGKVLFDSLGKPWPIHDCLGIKYERKKSKLKLSPAEWVQLTHFMVAPSSADDESTFFGLISGLEDQKQYEVSITLRADDQILIRDLYLNKIDYLKLSPEIEALIILDDGSHQFVAGSQIERKPFVMQDLSNKKPYTDQLKLL
jgi:hypothetical protein